MFLEFRFPGINIDASLMILEEEQSRKRRIKEMIPSLFDLGMRTASAHADLPMDCFRASLRPI